MRNGHILRIANHINPGDGEMSDKATVISELTRAIYLLQIDENQQGKALLTSAISAAADMDLTDLYEVSREDLAFLLSRALKYDIEPAYCTKLADHHFLSIEVEVKSDVPDWPVRIEIINRLMIEKDGERTNFTNKINLPHYRLLVSLIANGDGKLSIEKLKENLWPGRSRQKKDYRFYAAVTKLRKLIGVDSLLFRGNNILLNRRRCWVDHLAFKTMLNDLNSLNLNSSNDIYDLVHDVKNAISTHQNNFLVGVDDFFWRKNLAKESKDIITKTVLMLGQILEKNVDTETALSLYQHLIEINDSNEELYAKSMRCLSLLGYFSEAEQMYQQYKNVLETTGATTPSKRLMVLHRQLMAHHHVTPGNA